MSKENTKPTPLSPTALVCGMNAGVFAALAYSVVSITITLFNKVRAAGGREVWCMRGGVRTVGGRGGREPAVGSCGVRADSVWSGWACAESRAASPCHGVREQIRARCPAAQALPTTRTRHLAPPQATLSTYAFDSTMTLTLLQGVVTIVALETMKFCKYIDYPSFDWSVAKKVAPLSFVFIGAWRMGWAASSSGGRGEGHGKGISSVAWVEGLAPRGAARGAHRGGELPANCARLWRASQQAPRPLPYAQPTSSSLSSPSAASMCPCSRRCAASRWCSS